MNVMIDGTVLLGSQGGVRRYVAGLIGSLRSLHRITCFHILFRTFRRERRERLRNLVEAGEVAKDLIRQVNIPDRILEWIWHKRDIPLPRSRLLPGPCDVFLDTWYLVPRLVGCRLVTVVYDLIPLKMPDRFPAYHQTFQRRIELAIRRASILVAISEATKKDLHDFFGVHPDHVRVVNPGVAPQFIATTGGQENDRILERYGIQGPYILYVGSSLPNKGILTLLNAFRLLRDRWKVPHTLVLCGTHRDGGDAFQVERAVPDGLPVIVTGFVADPDLPSLYRQASVFAFLSTSEGFGLPPLEAMASGVPVVVCETPAIRESVGDAGTYVAADDPRQTADTLYRLLTDGTLRKLMTAKGLERVRRFTWAETARQMFAVLQEIYETRLPERMAGRQIGIADAHSRTGKVP